MLIREAQQKKHVFTEDSLQKKCFFYIYTTASR